MLGIKQEPTVVFGGLSEIIRAVIPVLLAFGYIHWSNEQIGLVLVLVGVVIGFLTILFTRSSTVPIVIADKQMEIAKASDITTDNALIIKQAKETV